MDLMSLTTVLLRSREGGSPRVLTRLPPAPLCLQNEGE